MLSCEEIEDLLGSVKSACKRQNEYIQLTFWYLIAAAFHRELEGISRMV